MGELGKLQVGQSKWARGLNEVIIIGFIEEITIEEALVRAKRGF